MTKITTTKSIKSINPISPAHYHLFYEYNNETFVKDSTLTIKANIEFNRSDRATVIEIRDFINMWLEETE